MIGIASVLLSLFHFESVVFMRYIYGPVKSRRLGNSLGVSVIGYKVCSYDCVYCQLKSTTLKTLKRRRYIHQRDILNEIKEFLNARRKNPVVHEKKPWPVHKESLTEGIDYITFSGSGEPTLNSDIGRLIKAVKKITSIPIVLITNGSTLIKPRVRKDILGVDIVVPSLDAVTQDIFERIDQPVKGILIKDIIDGLIRFRKEYKGKIWLEIMLVRGLNDSLEYFYRIKEVVDLVKPDKIHLNSPVRPPAQGWVKPVSAATLKKAKEIFGTLCEII